jgi:hypothetical protein
MANDKRQLKASWSTDRFPRWIPISRDDAARTLRGNRRASGVRVYRKRDELCIEGHGVCFAIARV